MNKNYKLKEHMSHNESFLPFKNYKIERYPLEDMFYDIYKLYYKYIAPKTGIIVKNKWL